MGDKNMLKTLNFDKLSKNTVDCMAKVPQTDRLSYARSTANSSNKRITRSKKSKYRNKSKCKSAYKIGQIQKEAKFKIDKVII